MSAAGVTRAAFASTSSPRRRVSPTQRTASVRRAASSATAVKAPTSTLGEETRGDFPILDQKTESGAQLVYLDNAATSQKPNQVVDAHMFYYKDYNSNVHRGVHYLSSKATDAYELSRRKVAAFVNATTDREIVFTRNASEAINLVANTWGTKYIKAGDEIILSVLEHHSNIVPWQLLAERTGCVLKFVEIDEGYAGTGHGSASLVGERKDEAHHDGARE